MDSSSNYRKAEDAHAAPQTTKDIENNKQSLVKAVNSREEFDEYLSTCSGKYILVEFYAVWCGTCKVLDKKFQDVAEKYPDKVVVLKINVDCLEDLAIEHGVEAMPSFIIFKDGKKLEQYFGSKLEQFNEMIEKYFDDPS